MLFFITKCDKSLHMLFFGIFKKLCDKQRKIHEFQNYFFKKGQKFITKRDKYYKLRQNLLQSVTGKL